MRLGTFSNNGLGFGLMFSLVDDFTMNARRIEREMARLTGTSAALAASVEANMARAKMGAGGLLVSLLGLAGWAKAAKQDAIFQNFELAFRSFLSSADEAHRVFETIKSQAIANPKFSIAGMEKANLLLISQGVNADKSMGAVKDLTTVLMGVGRGEPELNRVALAFEKIQAGGFLSGPQFRSLYTAGLPVVKMLKDIGINLDPSKITKAHITFDQLIEALHHAVGPAGQFGRVWEMMTNNVSALAAQIKENFSATMADIGKSIRPVTLAILKAVGALLNKIREFAGTDVGRWVFRTLFALNLLLFGLSLFIVIASVSRIMLFRMAGAFGATTKASMLTALSAGNTSAAFGIMGRAALGALAGIIPLVAKLAIFYAGYKLLQSTDNTFLFTIGAAMMLIAGPIGIVAAGFVFITRSVREFNAVMSGAKKPGEGILGVLQRVGAIIHFIGAAWAGFNKQTNEIEVPKKLIAVMDYLGLGDTARNIATWIGRLRYAWDGFKVGIEEGWASLKNGALEAINMLTPIGQQFSSWNDLLGINSDNLYSWKEKGKIAGRVVLIAFGSIVIVLAAMGVALLVNAALGVLTFLSWAAPILLALGLLALVIGAIEAISNAFSSSESSSTSAFSSMGSALSTFTTQLGTLAPQFQTIGENWGKGIVDGLQNTLSNWWAEQTYIDFDGGIFGRMFGADRAYRWQPLGGRKSRWISGDESTGVLDTSNGYTSDYFNKIGPPNNYIPMLDPTATRANYMRSMMGLPGESKTTEVIKTINVPVYLDGKQIANTVIDTMSFINATDYNDSSFYGAGYQLSVDAQGNNNP